MNSGRWCTALRFSLIIVTFHYNPFAQTKTVWCYDALGSTTFAVIFSTGQVLLAWKCKAWMKIYSENINTAGKRKFALVNLVCCFTFSTGRFALPKGPLSRDWSLLFKIWSSSCVLLSRRAVLRTGAKNPSWTERGKNFLFAQTETVWWYDALGNTTFAMFFVALSKVI